LLLLSLCGLSEDHEAKKFISAFDNSNYPSSKRQSRLKEEEEEEASK
jgi:hypothetical protein